MRTKLVAGNWKLNGAREANQALISGVLNGAAGLDACEIMVCPPYVYLAEIKQQLKGNVILLGAQDVASESSGAFTGEVAASMLSEVGCTHVIIGHSERRALYGETDAVVASKFLAAHAGGLTPVLCVGETLEERESGVTMEVIERQVSAVIKAAGVEPFANSIIAYEPVWAIGTGLTASPEQAQEVHARVRAIIADSNAKIAADLRILYGGSVKGANAPELFAQKDIDGGLIGGASLDADEFLSICKAAAGTN